MQSQRDIHEVLVILQREPEDRQNFLMTIENLVTRGQYPAGPTATQLIGTATHGCVTPIDATERHHPNDASVAEMAASGDHTVRVQRDSELVPRSTQTQHVDNKIAGSASD
jgi:hypothetical protein